MALMIGKSVPIKQPGCSFLDSPTKLHKCLHLSFFKNQIENLPSFLPSFPPYFLPLFLSSYLPLLSCLPTEYFGKAKGSTASLYCLPPELLDEPRE